MRYFKSKKLLTLVTVSGLLLSTVNQVVLAEVNTTQTVEEKAYLKVTDSSGIVIYHKKIKKNQLIQVFNEKNEVIQSEELNQDLTVTIPSVEIPEQKILSYWNVEEVTDHIEIKPVFEKTKEGTLKLTTEGSGFLLNEQKQLSQLTLPYKLKQDLKSVLPEIKSAKGNKFLGWFVEGKKIDSKKFKLENKETELTAKFYQDLNDNSIDDSTESATIKFITNSEEKIPDLTIFVGKYVELPILKKDNEVFLGWFIDENLKEKFNNSVPITEDLTLYAKWENAEKVISDSKKQKLTDPVVTKQIEDILKNVNDLQSVVKNDKQNSIKPQPSPQAPTPQKTSPDSSKDKNGSLYTNTVRPQTSYDNREIKYTFSNANVAKNYILNFSSEKDKNLFSLLVPYGETVRVYNLQNKKIKEYSARQNTTIKLDTVELFGKHLTEPDYYTTVTKINSKTIIDVHPTKPTAKTLDDTDIRDFESSKSSKQKLGMILFGSLGVILLALIGLLVYLFKPQKFLKKHKKIKK